MVDLATEERNILIDFYYYKLDATRNGNGSAWDGRINPPASKLPKKDYGEYDPPLKKYWDIQSWPSDERDDNHLIIDYLGVPGWLGLVVSRIDIRER